MITENSYLQSVPEEVTTLRHVSLDDKYTAENGHVFLTGIQALVRLPMMQIASDRDKGLNTAGYISGYRGSPLGTYDAQLQKAKKELARYNIIFQPGVNEDLAATAVWGSQQAQTLGEGRYDGVIGIWYGKGPGVDRSGDAFRHANLAGSSDKGGVLVLMGDDHTCESSTTCHQSEFALVDAMIPILSPANVEELLSYGLAGWAMSRYSGLWVGLKCVKDVADATGIVDLDAIPQCFTPSQEGFPTDGLNIRQPDTPHAQEYRLHNHKLDAARRFAFENRLDIITIESDRPWLGIATHGKSHLDVMNAFAELRLTPEALGKLGIRVYKVAMVWPLEPKGALEFSKGLETILVVEEKRSLLESQLREVLYDNADRPRIMGKRDGRGNRLFQEEMSLNAIQIAVAIGEVILERSNDTRLATRVQLLQSRNAPGKSTDLMPRSFYFCSGCPHNTSTKVPNGSRAYAGIGCSWMAQSMDRSTLGYTQMGAEGTSWVGEAPFSERTHIFQNMGDGTYFHSGLLALRAAVSAHTNITFKILFNDAVAMTGGQQHDGPLTPQAISWQVYTEGVQKIAVVTDDPGKYEAPLNWSVHPEGVAISPSRPSLLGTFAPGTTIHHRDELESVQSRLRDTKGTTVLIYDQMCAAEKRRQRKRGKIEDPAKRLFINELVCEGCGDCGIQSNCVSLQPVETDFGRKRKIDQFSCNKDYSCLKGFCPSFVTVEGGSFRPRISNDLATDDLRIPEPIRPALIGPYTLLITGVGGTGVVTVGAILGMAAHIEGKGFGALDMAGLAQKGGSVWSHLRFTPSPQDTGSIRISPGGADAIVGGDLLVTASSTTLGLMRQETKIIINTHESMPGRFALQADLHLPKEELLSQIKSVVSHGNVSQIDANALAINHCGDPMASNMVLLGYAYQQGLIPISASAILRAIETNGVAVKSNQRAFDLGRQAALDPDAQYAPHPGTSADGIDELIERRAKFLTNYQNTGYSLRYRSLVDEIRQFESTSFPGSTSMTEAVARYYFKLLAYKDEYEIARLYAKTDFLDSIRSQFEGQTKIKFNLSPPTLTRAKSRDSTRTREFGPWILSGFDILARMKFLRGTPFDPFGYSEERREERQLIVRYERLVKTITSGLSPDSSEIALRALRLPERIRGYGHVKVRHLKQVLPEWKQYEDALGAPGSLRSEKHGT